VGGVVVADELVGAGFGCVLEGAQDGADAGGVGAEGACEGVLDILY